MSSGENTACCYFAVEFTAPSLLPEAAQPMQPVDLAWKFPEVDRATTIAFNNGPRLQ
jgi:hypothetical protein